jgi:hypothetical protein
VCVMLAPSYGAMSSRESYLRVTPFCFAAISSRTFSTDPAKTCFATQPTSVSNSFPDERYGKTGNESIELSIPWDTNEPATVALSLKLRSQDAITYL